VVERNESHDSWTIIIVMSYVETDESLSSDIVRILFALCSLIDL